MNFLKSKLSRFWQKTNTQPKSQEVSNEKGANQTNSLLNEENKTNLEEKEEILLPNLSSFFQELFDIALTLENNDQKKSSLYIEELLDPLKEVDISKDSNFDKLDSLLMIILSVTNPVIFENSKAKFQYLVSLLSRTNESKNIKLLKAFNIDIQELVFTISNHAINLLIEPDIYGIDAKYTGLLLQHIYDCCFKETNEANRNIIATIFETMDKQCSEDKIEKFLDFMCPFISKNLFYSIKLVDLSSIIYFFYDACNESPSFFKVFSNSKFSFYHPFFDNPQYNSHLFQHNHFLTYLLHYSYFPYENTSAIQLFQNENMKSAEVVMDGKRKELDDYIYAPYIKLILLYINSGKSLQEQILNWISKVILLNKQRGNELLQQSLMSDSIYHNFVYIIINVFQEMVPIKSHFEKMVEINTEWLFTNKKLQGLVQYNENSKVKARFANLPETNCNFITQYYYLTSFAHSLYKIYHKKYAQITKAYSIEKHKSPQIDTPIAKKIQKDLSCFKLELFDPKFVKARFNLIHFDSLNIVKILNYTVNNKVEFEKLFLKMFSEKIENLECIPIFMIENMTDLIRFIKECKIHFFTCGDQELTENAQFLLKIVSNYWVLCLGSNNWSTNPHFRAEIMRTLCVFILSHKFLKHHPQSDSVIIQKLTQIIVTNPLYQEHIMEALIKFFIDIEKTGSHNQFFEKFSHRHNFFFVQNYFLNQSPSFVKKLSEWFKNNTPLSLKFMNLMLNDIIYLLDELIEKIKAIKTFEDAHPLNTTHHVHPQVIYNHQRNIQNAKHVLQFLLRHYESLEVFTLQFPELLLKEELVDKFAANINYSLVKFHGDEACLLKIRDPKMIGYDPFVITKSLVKSLLNMRNYEKIYDALVRDGRSFSLHIYNETGQAFFNGSVVDNTSIKLFDQFIQILEKKTAENKLIEDKINTEDIPEEFVDPIMNEIMKDPVLLPTSSTIVDRITIVKHLLSDPTDPFNRQPLKEEELIPQIELKNKIQAFLKKLVDEKK